MMGCLVLLGGCLTKPNPEWDAGASGGSTTVADPSTTTALPGSTGDSAATTSGDASSQGTDTTTGVTSATTSSAEATGGSTGEPLVCGNQGEDCFGPPIMVAVDGDEPRAAWAGDLDGDGNGDVVLTYSGSHQVQLLRGDGAGGLAPDDPIAAGGNDPFDLHVSDLDADGQLDVMTANAGADHVAVFELDGTLAMVGTHSAGKRPEALSTGHLDDDGRLDLVVALRDDDMVGVLTGQEDLSLNSVNVYPFGNSPEGLSVADFDRDGIDDVVAACDGGGGGVVIRLGESGGFKTDPLVLFPGGHFIDVVAVDIDNDDNPDIAAITHEDSILYVWWGDGAGGVEDLDPVMLLLSPGNGVPTRIAAGDVDADTYVDFVIGRVGTNDLSLIRATPNRGFSGAKSLPTSGPPWDIALGQLNDDPFLDIVVTLPSIDAIDVFLTQP